MAKHFRSPNHAPPPDPLLIKDLEAWNTLPSGIQTILQRYHGVAEALFTALEQGVSHLPVLEQKETVIRAMKAIGFNLQFEDPAILEADQESASPPHQTDASNTPPHQLQPDELQSRSPHYQPNSQARPGKSGGKF